MLIKYGIFALYKRFAVIAVKTCFAFVFEDIYKQRDISIVILRACVHLYI